MAWSMSDYWEFVHEVMGEYDLSVSEARELYADVRDDLGQSLYGGDLLQQQELVEEVLVAGYGFEYIDEPDEVEEGGEGDGEVDYGYELDDRFLDDDWLDAGDDVEITAELAYE